MCDASQIYWTEVSGGSAGGEIFQNPPLLLPVHPKASNSFLEKCFKQSRSLKCIFHLTMHTKLIDLASRSRGYYLLLLSHQVVSGSLWPHGLRHTRLPCPSLSPGVCSTSCPSSQRWHPTISSSLASFTSCPQSFPASWSFPMNQLFSSGDQNIRASVSVLPMNTQGWFPLGLTGLISSQSKGLSRGYY